MNRQRVITRVYISGKFLFDDLKTEICHGFTAERKDELKGNKTGGAYVRQENGFAAVPERTKRRSAALSFVHVRF